MTKKRKMWGIGFFITLTFEGTKLTSMSMTPDSGVKVKKRKMIKK